MILGIPEFEAWKISAGLARRKEISFHNVRRQNNCLRKAIDFIANGSIDAGPLITHELPFSAASEAFELVSSYRDGVMKAVIRF